MQTRCTRSGQARAKVLGVDRHARRRHELEAALSCLAIEVCWIDATDVEHRTAPALPIAMVCLSAGPGDEGPEDRYVFVRQLVASGCRVIAYSDGCGDWTISERCHAVVLGVSTLLDSARSSFEAELGATLVRWVEEDCRRRDARREDQALMASLGIVGCSTAIANTLAQVRRAARLSDLSVLLVGETGSGKELMAKAIHRLDERRRDAPLIAVNCAAITSALAEDELFGHRRGAFTGAHRDKRGLFRAAHGGMLFLDEIGELSDVLQGKLLRVIQEQRVMPVGADQEEPIDVRIVAATHRDLAGMVHEGRFREDLYFRLCVLPIVVPPLRERREDIAALIDHFLTRHAERHGGQTPEATQAFREALSHHELPGNVRQLDNILRQAIVAASDAPVLDLVHLPADVLRSIDRARLVAPLPMTPDGTVSPQPVAALPSLLEVFTDEGWNLERCVDSCERALIATALVRSHGNQTATARLLGVTPRCIYSKLRKHHLH